MDWTQLRKSSLNLRINQQKLPKLKSEGKKDWEKRTQNRIPTNHAAYKRCLTHIMRTQKEKRERNQKNI